MDLIRQPAVPAIQRLGILPGSFNPPTIAHVELARTALQRLDAVLLVIPRVFPHAKDFRDVSLEDRISMLRNINEPRFGIAVSDRGLFIDIAQEAKPRFQTADLWFLCGADAAARIVNWDYGAPGEIHRMLKEFGLLVARRGELYQPPDDIADRIEMLPVQNLDEVSSTEVRCRIKAQRDWRHLVPAEIQDEVSRIYS